MVAESQWVERSQVDLAGIVAIGVVKRACLRGSGGAMPSHNQGRARWEWAFAWVCGASSRDSPTTGGPCPAVRTSPRDFEDALGGARALWASGGASRSSGSNGRVKCRLRPSLGGCLEFMGWALAITIRTPSTTRRASSRWSFRSLCPVRKLESRPPTVRIEVVAAESNRQPLARIVIAGEPSSTSAGVGSSEACARA